MLTHVGLMICGYFCTIACVKVDSKEAKSRLLSEDDLFWFKNQFLEVDNSHSVHS